jgi:folate-binding protein YgfZ
VARELERYVFTEDVDTADVTDEWEVLGLFGPAALRVLESAGGCEKIIDLQPDALVPLQLGETDCLVVREDMGSTLGLILLVKADALDKVYELLIEQVGGIVPDIDQSGEANPTGPKRSLVGRAIGWSAYNTARIESGVPMFRIDFGPDCLPHETSLLQQTVSFTKGCYLGQEVVARMESRGHPKRKLVGVKFESADLPIAGTLVQAPDGDVIGGITSSTNAPLLSQHAIAFAMVKWGKHRKGTAIQVGAEGKLIDGTVSELKFV